MKNLVPICNDCMCNTCLYSHMRQTDHSDCFIWCETHCKGNKPNEYCNQKYAGKNDIVICADYEPYYLSNPRRPKCSYYTTSGFCIEMLHEIDSCKDASVVCSIICCWHCKKLSSCKDPCPIAKGGETKYAF